MRGKFAEIALEWVVVAHFALMQGFPALHSTASNKKRKPSQHVTATALKNGAEGETRHFGTVMP